MRDCIKMEGCSLKYDLNVQLKLGSVLIIAGPYSPEYYEEKVVNHFLIETVYQCVVDLAQTGN